MLPVFKTSVYNDAATLIHKILKEIPADGDPVNRSIHKKSLQTITTLATALEHIEDIDSYQSLVEECLDCITESQALLDFAKNLHSIDVKVLDNFTLELMVLKKKIHNFAPSRKKILILSSNMGQGHNSASKAIRQGLETLYGYDYFVEIIDFWELMNAFVNKFTLKTYENSTKFAPKFYKFIFESTDAKWQMKLINQINYPFVISKVRKMFEDKNPDLIISTFPIWNYMIAEIWKQFKPAAPFLSVVTDSISIHHAWAIAKTDFNIVANEDTATSLMQLGVTRDKIKILGFPVRTEFMDKKDNRKETFSALGLNPDKFTVLFLPTAQSIKKNLKIMNELAENNKDRNLIVITGRDEKLKPKLKKFTDSGNTVVLGWTDKMADYLKNCDLVITKAGGATVMECIACEKPMIITSIIPGQEEGNGELLKRYRLGIIPAETNMGINESIGYIRKNYNQFKKNLAKISNPKASLKIAEFIHEMI